MAFTPAQERLITGAFSTKARQAKCPGCGFESFTLGQGIVYLQLGPTVDETNPFSSRLKFGGPSLPCVPIICTTCGNTQMYNIFVLGVAEALGFRQPGRVIGGKDNE